MSWEKAVNFKPCFNSSELFKFCSPEKNEKEELQLVLKSYPFNSLNEFSGDSDKYYEDYFKTENWEKITKLFTSDLFSGTTQFNDDKILKKYYSEEKQSLAVLNKDMLTKQHDNNMESTPIKNSHEATQLGQTKSNEVSEIKTSKRNLNFENESDLKKLKKIDQNSIEDSLIATNLTDEKTLQITDSELVKVSVDYERVNQIKTNDSLTQANNADEQELLIDDDELAAVLIKYENESKEREKTLSEIRQTRGVLLEPNIIKKINQDLGTNFIKNSIKSYYRADKFIICGEVDGIDTGTNTILEIKTKKYINFSNSVIELRERLQCLSYMKILKCSKCLLVHSGPNGIYRKFWINFDENEFNQRIESRLDAISTKYRNISKDDFEKLVKKYKKNVF